MDLLDAEAAARFLGVKRATLYAYVSRGLLSSVSDEGDQRRRLYRRGDLERLKRRSDAHAGVGAAAVGAFDWGAPSLETALTDIRPEGPAYRGRPLPDLLSEDVPFEGVAELLWTGVLPEAPPRWMEQDAPAVSLPDRLPADAGAIDVLRVATVLAGLEDEARFAASPDARLALGRRMLVRLVRTLVARRGDAEARRRKPDSAGAAATVAECLAKAVGASSGTPAAPALDRALTAVADHEMNASAFSARVAASTGADLYACVGAALATFSGPLHGGACDRCEALLAEMEREGSARAVIRRRLRRGESPPGFGHRLYPDGDPRFDLILGGAGALEDRAATEARAMAEDLGTAAREAGLEPPTADMGLALLARALGLARDAGGILFAVGRLAGWIAHAEEQRRQGFLLRPRARYVGG